MVLRKMLVSLILASLLLASAGVATAAEPAAQGNPASAPSPLDDQVQPFSVWDPSQFYLDTGNSFVSDNGNHVFKAIVSTFASTTVSQIGVKLYIEKWNGSSWNLVGSMVPLQGSNTDYYTTTYTQTVLGGYYYRARTVHWIQQGSVYEQGELVGGSVYVN